MAKQTRVWGIEIGQAALKALRCHLEGDQVVADAHDYIEYPKLLSQPEAEPEALIAEAISTFLGRNETRGDRIAISVHGQMGLAKFFKPPPVEQKKIGDIVKYEAKQQIPFDLSDVVWDFQTMAGSTIEDGYVLETEVGLFAMKREQAYRALKPFTDAGLEVDIVQLAPLALYNMIGYDRLHERIEGGLFDTDNPPPSTVLLALGTDASDLIVTNGFRIWQRNMPLGGNFFTRQLTKDLKLTFAKAEHLKRNAKQAEDPKMVFQAMRPAFNELVTEVQRSVGYFQNINKKAQIGELLLAGNAVKLSGLSTYLNKNLGYDVHVLDHFQRLGGTEVTGAPTFKENVFTYGVCYGLCLQGLGKGPIRTSLVPREILTERLVRSKKPWAIAGVAALLSGCMLHYAFLNSAWKSVDQDRWKVALQAADATNSASTREKGEDDKRVGQMKFLTAVGTEVAGEPERRLQWLELLAAIDQVLPRGNRDYPDGSYPSPKDYAFEKRPDIQITKIESQYFSKVEALFYSKDKMEDYYQDIESWAELTGNEVPKDFATKNPGPKGEGWVIRLDGYHFFNLERGSEGPSHVRKTLINNVLTGTVSVPTSINGEKEAFKLSELGITYPLMYNESMKAEDSNEPNPDYDGSAEESEGFGGAGKPSFGSGGAAGGGSNSIGEDGGGDSKKSSEPEKPKEPATIKAKRYDFTLYLFWQPNTLTQRLEARAKLEAENKKNAKTGGDVAMTSN
jgi:type IV pilus assembly protein PilM